jgi:hypothetical protein
LIGSEYGCRRAMPQLRARAICTVRLVVDLPVPWHEVINQPNG